MTIGLRKKSALGTAMSPKTVTTGHVSTRVCPTGEGRHDTAPIKRLLPALVRFPFVATLPIDDFGS
jgi:hypothetical protein